MSYLISVKTGELVAHASKELKSGERVLVSFQRCKEEINADRKWNLVNAFECKASNAKKWEKQFRNSESVGGCAELNPNEFYIV